MALNVGSPNDAYNELLDHEGHELECVSYGRPGECFNVAIECRTCEMVLIDFDNPNLQRHEEAR